MNIQMNENQGFIFVPHQQITEIQNGIHELKELMQKQISFGDSPIVLMKEACSLLKTTRYKITRDCEKLNVKIKKDPGGRLYLLREDFDVLLKGLDIE